MNRGCDVRRIYAIMLKDKRCFRYQMTRIRSEVPGFAAHMAALGMGCVVGGPLCVGSGEGHRTLMSEKRRRV